MLGQLAARTPARRRPPGPRAPESVQREPDDDLDGLLLDHERGELGEVLRRRASSVATGVASSPRASQRATPTRTLPDVDAEADALPDLDRVRPRPRDGVVDRRERSRDARRRRTAALGHVVLAATTPVDVGERPPGAAPGR